MSSGLSSGRSSPIPDLTFDPSYRSTLVHRQAQPQQRSGQVPLPVNNSNNLDSTNPGPSHRSPRLPNPNIQQSLGFSAKDYVTVKGDIYALGPYTTESLTLWILMAILIILVIVNLVVTFTLFGTLRLGYGMESIEFLPDLLKFYGDIDLDEINKFDGILQSFQNEGMEISAEESGKIHLWVHEGSGPSLSLDKTGINVTNVDEFRVTSSSGHKIFSTSSPTLDLPTGIKDFRAKIARVNRITSAINSSLELSSSSFTHLKGSEGTRIEGNRVLISADRNITLRAMQGSLIVSGRKGVSFYTESLPLVEAFGVTRNQHTYPTQGKKQSQFKICICMPTGKLFRIEIPVGNNKSSAQNQISCNSVQFNCE